MSTVDDNLYNLRRRPDASTTLSNFLGLGSNVAPSGQQTPGGGQTWGPKMWRLIDKEMTLRECEVYCYSPDEDPFDGEENALWSLNYLFFNKNRKRVCYIYLRGLSISSHSPGRTPASATNKRGRPLSHNTSFASQGATKRARYWLGEKAPGFMVSGLDEDQDEFAVSNPGDDEVDADYGSDYSLRGYSDSEDDEIERHCRERSAVRGMSEHIAESMEV